MTEADLRDAVRARVGDALGIIVEEFFSEQNNEDRFRVVIVGLDKTSSYEIGVHEDGSAFANFLDFIESDR